ncbi:MAG: LemA family protein [Nanoarchaeota archaeon]|jgi:LemA protein|nr:LemA family protein [Nanoarchaeota archaeon]
MVVAWIIGGVVVLGGLITVRYYNRFVTLANRIDNSLSQINVQLKRRSDLIPSLIETVKGFAKHEKGIMKEVSDARKVMMGAKGLEGKMKANGALEGALGKLFAIAENYPQLKADTNFLELQKELSSTEDRVAYSRQNYNDSILRYNVLCEKFPGVIFAGMFSKTKRTYIELEPGEEKKPEVKF